MTPDQDRPAATPPPPPAPSTWPAAWPRRIRSSWPAPRARRVWDTEGREYLDFIGGIGVLNTGHRHPRVMEAVQRQLDAFTHTCFQVASYDGYVELSARLNALVAGGPNKTLLLTTGVEATENAVKIARAATNRPGVDRLPRRLPRPHAAGAGADRVEHRLPPELRPVRAGGLPHAVPLRVPRRSAARRRWRRCSTCSTRAIAPGAGGGDHHRAAAGRGRLRAGAGRVPARAAAPLHRPRHRAHRRRDPDRLRPHRPDVRLRALRHRARSGDDGQEPRRRAAAVGGGRQGGDHGRAGRRRPGRHLRRQSRWPAPRPLAVLDVFEDEHVLDQAMRAGRRPRARRCTR